MTASGCAARTALAYRIVRSRSSSKPSGSGCRSRCVVLQSIGSLSSIYSDTLCTPVFRSCDAMAATHRATHPGGAAVLVIAGGPGAIGVPAVLTPFPTSGRQGSVFACGPNDDTGNAYEVASFATHPIIGNVTAALASCAVASARKAV